MIARDVAILQVPSMASPRRGRPASSKRNRISQHDEAISGHAMGVVCEAGAGIEHLEIARQADRQHDLLLLLLKRQISEGRELLLEGNVRRCLGMLMAMDYTVDNAMANDAIEDEQYEREATGHVALARDEGRAIVGLVEMPGAVA